MAKKAWKELEGQFFRIDVGSTQAEALASEESNVLYITTEQSMVMNGEVVGRGGDESYIRVMCNNLVGTSPVITADGKDVTLRAYGCFKVECNGNFAMKTAPQAVVGMDFSHYHPTNLTSLLKAFYGVQSMNKLDLSGIDISNVTSLNLCFSSMRNLRELDVSTWDTSKVTNMTGIFASCTNLKEVDISSFTLNSVNTDFCTLFSTTKTGATVNLEKLWLGKRFFDAPNLTYVNLKASGWTDTESITRSLYTNLYNRKTAGQPTLTLALSSNTVDAMADGQKTRLTDYGYTLA